MRHTLYWHRGPASGRPPTIGEIIEIDGDEAMHGVKAKRLREGEVCRACDGAGVVLLGEVIEAKRSRLRLRIDEARFEAPTTPRLEVCSATPKGQRLEKMLDMLAQCGVAVWRPLVTRRGVVEPGAHKLERAERISIEALKQCGRAHLMRIEGDIGLEEALDDADGTRVVVADGTGDSGAWEGDAERVRVLVGPEGGFSDEELALVRERGARVARLGPHVLRIEAASVLASGWVMHTSGDGAVPGA